MQTLEELPIVPRLDGNVPNRADGINAIADLARAASPIAFLKVPTEGMGPGLPPHVILQVDHRDPNKTKALKSEIEVYRQMPARRIGTARATTLRSFIELVQRHKDANTAIFATTQWPQPKLTAVIDYHQVDGTPRWGNHRVEYAFPVTDELKVWIAGNGKAMEQAEFAAFLEEHAAELSAPYDQEKSDYERLFNETMTTPNEVLALSRHLEVHVGAKVKRGERLQTGERTVEFTEEHTNARGEKVEIPGLFMVQVAAFLDGAPVRLVARLRYRIAGGTIHWSYHLYRWDVALRERVQQDLTQAEADTGLPTYEGAPEA